MHVPIRRRLWQTLLVVVAGLAPPAACGGNAAMTGVSIGTSAGSSGSAANTPASGAGVSGNTAPAGNGGTSGLGGASGSGGDGGVGGSHGGFAGAPEGGAGSGGTSTLVECTEDADCTVLGDCCGCQATPKGTASNCQLDCVANRCLELTQAPEPRCVFGQCVLSTNCYFPPLQPVTCGQKPSCPSGQVPSVAAGCYGPAV